MAEDGRLSDDQVTELLGQADAAPDTFDPTLRAALLEIHIRRLGDKVPTPPQRQAAGMAGPTLAWARQALETAIENLYDDPYGVVDERGEGREISVLEAWDEYAAIGAELQVDLKEVAGRLASEYERGRMEKILESGRWAKTQVAGSEPEEAEAL